MVLNDAVQSRSPTALSVSSSAATLKRGLLKRQKPASIFAKLTTPLSSLGGLRPPRNSRRALSEFYVQLEEPHRQYSPGDLVKGSVLVTVERDTKVTHIVVDLVGRVDLYGVANSGYTPGGKRKKVNYAAPVEFEGGVILCRDQQVLCGEGRLETGVYEFKFVMELVGKGLPSSLDFEKGSISYNISATFTRPTKISPIKICEHRLTVVELVDIAPLKPPKPRIITLDQGSKRGRLKSSHSSSDEKGVISQPKASSTPPSPAASNHQICLENSSVERSIKISRNATVTATVELLKAGCLRGDFLPIRVTIAHNKPIKSMQGIIVTLIRQGRFDTVPLSASFLNSKSSSSSLKKGLSLSSGGSTTTFRKDLSQTIMPLIVDPTTLTAVIKTSVRVPEDAFPTITSVPGCIVSFRYFVEVVVDLRGKLLGKDGFLDGVGMMNTPTGITNDNGDGKGKIVSGTADPSGMMALWSGQVMETDNIRRDVKNVVTCRFEVVVGTTDSASGKGRRQTLVPAETPLREELQFGNCEDRNLGNNTIVEPLAEQLQHQVDQAQPLAAPDYAIEDIVTTSGSQYNPALTPIPEPSLSTELNEKRRLELAEQSLLPSEPPAFDDARPSDVSALAPSAPPLCDEHELYILSNNSPSEPIMNHPYLPSAPTIDLNNEQPQHDQGTSPIGGDKQEMERRRLMEAISQPPQEGPSMAPSNTPPVDSAYFCPADLQPLPTAPILDEEGDRELPRYER